jgi:hypothetical protein
VIAHHRTLAVTAFLINREPRISPDVVATGSAPHRRAYISEQGGRPRVGPDTFFGDRV